MLKYRLMSITKKERRNESTNPFPSFKQSDDRLLPWMEMKYKNIIKNIESNKKQYIRYLRCRSVLCKNINLISWIWITIISITTTCRWQRWNFFEMIVQRKTDGSRFIFSTGYNSVRLGRLFFTATSQCRVQNLICINR